MGIVESESELANLLTHLLEDCNKNARFFAEFELPEYAIARDLDLDTEERARYFTFSIIPYHVNSETREPKRTTGRGGLWRVCGNLWETHPWAFQPDQLVEDNRQKQLQDFFSKLEIMDSYDSKWWIQSGKTIASDYDGDPRAILDEGDYVAPNVAEIVRTGHFPGIADEICTPIWIRMMDEKVHQISSMDSLAMPVDHPIFFITKTLGGLDVTIDEPNDRELIYRYWELITEKHGLRRFKLEQMLRLLAYYWEQGGQEYLLSRLKEIRS